MTAILAAFESIGTLNGPTDSVDGCFSKSLAGLFADSAPFRTTESETYSPPEAQDSGL